MRRLLLRSLVFGYIIESVALFITFGLYSLRHGREPMEPPLNLIATVLQMPGNVLANALTLRYVYYSGVFLWGCTYLIQASLWSLLIYVVLIWRHRWRNHKTSV